MPEKTKGRPMDEIYRNLLEVLGEDVNREGLIKTPERAAEAMRYLTRGYSQNVDKVINEAFFEADTDEMIIVKDIELYSLCEHHLLPFIGKAHVAYMPRKKIVGLSKIARIVDVFARRLQVQERLTNQIAESLMDALNPLGVAVVMEGLHMCMVMRGIEKQNSFAMTSSMLGAFRTQGATRAEFMNLLQLSRESMKR
jgi:GTP cyclohydrolase I